MSLGDLQITHAPGAVVAHLTGEIDMSNAEDLGVAVIGATPSEALGVVLDLSAVDYIDSAGIYVIHGMRTSLQARGQALVLVIPEQSPVHDALRLSGAQRPGEIVEDIEAAMRAVEAASTPDS